MIAKISAFLGRFPALRNFLRRTYRIFVPLRTDALQDRIEKILKRESSVFFVQVGANDGIQGDQIHGLIGTHQEWRGMFIEPVGYVFQRLKENYSSSERFIFENVAVGAERGPKAFYYVSQDARTTFGDDLPFWYDQLGSFDRTHIVKFLGARIEPFIIEEKVQCFPLMEILDKHDVRGVTILNIDTEGYDYQILSGFDFHRHRPKVVLYEHKHLSEEEKVKARSLVKRAGYRVSVHGGNTLAVLRR